ncbi:MAG: 4-hydroxythreonine-4-phosphate dehydrogenase PdxA [Deltaproteobacteria bacterium]|nr:4-hydroxythreonine-4-phosphate dehydrogenase PdxA [Deltaproteobacteria bacterium]
MKPVLAITLGDPSGIGPEIAAKSLATALAVSRPVLFGHAPSLRAAALRAGLDLPLGEGGATLVGSGPPGPALDTPGPEAARAALEALDAAVDAVLAGRCEALVTGPVAKRHIAGLSPGFTGHTEHLARRAGLGPDDVTMTFIGERLVVGLATTHVPLADVPRAVTSSRIERTVVHVIEAAKRLHSGQRPRVAVAALNPHAGEGGLLGREEIDLIEPLCRRLGAALDATISGPHPADAAFRDAVAGLYDGVVALYHDQAMIPLKLLGFGRFANVTLGLPFVRTSPDHGVAYDIAGRDAADPAGMRRAIEVAVRLLSP